MSHVMTGKQCGRTHVESVHKGLKCELKLSLSYELSRQKNNIHFMQQFIELKPPSQ